MPMDKNGMMEEEEYEIEKTQKPATGAEASARDTHNIEDEIAAMGITPQVVPGHGQGGNS